MEDVELLAVEADGLYLLNCYGPPDRYREELAQTIIRVGQTQKSLWAGDFNEEPNDMVTHTLRRQRARTSAQLSNHGDISTNFLGCGRGCGRGNLVPVLQALQITRGPIVQRACLLHR